MRTTHRRSVRGFSVFETLLGGSLTALCALGFAAALPATDPRAQSGVHAARAVVLVEEMMVTVRNRPVSQLQQYNGRDGQGTDTRDPANFPPDSAGEVTDPFTPPSPRADLARWDVEIGQTLNATPVVSGGYGTIRVESVARDESGTSILDKVTVALSWTEGGIERRVAASTLASRL